MPLAAKRDERFDPGRRAGCHIGLAEITGVSQHNFSLAKLFRQGARLSQHRLKLPFIVGGLRHVAGDDQQAAFRHNGLRVIALLEAAA